MRRPALGSIFAPDLCLSPVACKGGGGDGSSSDFPRPIISGQGSTLPLNQAKVQAFGTDGVAAGTQVLTDAEGEFSIEVASVPDEYQLIAEGGQASDGVSGDVILRDLIARDGQ